MVSTDFIIPRKVGNLESALTPKQRIKANKAPVFLALYDVKLKVFKPSESLLVKHVLGG